jgi:hypothetical protein
MTDDPVGQCRLQREGRNSPFTTALLWGAPALAIAAVMRRVPADVVTIGSMDVAVGLRWGAHRASAKCDKVNVSYQIRQRIVTEVHCIQCSIVYSP